MPDLVVIVPSRGRPQAAHELAKAFDETCAADTALVFAVNSDDPTIDEYGRAGNPGGTFGVPARSMVEALNFAVGMVAPAFAIAFMGDDHRPRTKGWDERYLETLRDLGTGIVYGNDLLQGANLPTQCAMTADIVQALGYMAPPRLHHMYVDNFWLDLGRAAGCIRYLPDVVVEHLHPFAGKAGMDAGYERVNAPAVYQRDGAAYAAYTRSELPAAVAKVRALRTVST